MIEEILEDNKSKIICSKFINTLVKIVLEFSSLNENLPIVLSGGVFQNKTLLELILDKFEQQSREVYYSKNIPLNDGGISAGQIYHVL